MLNPGESAILAAGRAVERLVPRERGIAVAPMIALTFTFDHRVVDGAVGGAALSELADLLEGGIEWRALTRHRPRRRRLLRDRPLLRRVARRRRAGRRRCST